MVKKFKLVAEPCNMDTSDESKPCVSKCEATVIERVTDINSMLLIALNTINDALHALCGNEPESDDCCSPTEPTILNMLSESVFLANELKNKTGELFGRLGS